MVTKTVQSREEVAPEFKWNLEAVYQDDAQWEKDLSGLVPLLDQASAARGRLGESAQTLLRAIEDRDRLYEQMERIFAYARMRRDEDTTNSHYLALEDRARAQLTRISETMSFFSPELLEVGEEKVHAFMDESAELKLYAHQFDELFREKEHMLSEAEEALLAAAGEIASGPGQIFDMMTDADMKFGTIKDEDGNDVELTQGSYIRYIRSKDRRVRKDAFEIFHSEFTAQRNALASCYATQVKSDMFYSRARKYGSSLEAALFKDNIPVSVYENLITAVHENLPLLHRYMELRRRVLGVDKLHMYDLHVPLIPQADNEIPYSRATEMVTEAFTPMGETYLNGVKQGFNSRWTDVYETPNKSSGAYSWGVYGVHPFMLLNYQDTLYDVFTLAHEMGHSMHSYYSYQTQPYTYHNYTLFVAEVASTLNEELLSHHLLNSTDDRAIQLAVINHSLEQVRTTLYRQTMFAEFEKIAHERAEAGEALTADMLSQVHYALNKQYHGDDVAVDEEIQIEWARIPHFYRSFYVYQYSTGISAAIALSQQILEEGQPAVDRYIKFLSSGGSNYSVNLLKDAGVDVTTPEPVNQALQQFGRNLDKLEELLAAEEQSAVGS
ncbi:MAG TPA: oligoendopeptidase F [Chloroflexia bacterium]|nr:oligoendopeptidase F [Chloroflexia bacterium]